MPVIVAAMDSARAGEFLDPSNALNVGVGSFRELIKAVRISSKAAKWVDARLPELARAIAEGKKCKGLQRISIAPAESEGSR